MCCYCVNPCGWFLREVAKSTKHEGGGFGCEDLHDGCESVKRTYLWGCHKHDLWQLKTMWLLEKYCSTLCPDYKPLITCQAFKLHDWYRGFN